MVPVCLAHPVLIYLSLSLSSSSSPSLPQRKITLLTRPQPQPASNPTVIAASAGVTGSVASVGNTPGPTLIAANPLSRYTYTGCMLVCMRVAVWCEVSWWQSVYLACLDSHIEKTSQPPDCILCMRYQSQSSRHPSTADEACCWPKCVLHIGFT